MRSLFDPPASATADPDTSRDAEAAHSASGRRATNCAAVLDLVRRHPGSTYLELCGYQAAEGLQLGSVEIMRRLNDLKIAGKVRKGAVRPCKVNGHKMTTWEAA